ncbi:MAG: hypothetical protein V8Q17_06645 [Acutalibacteraceae bacterium]
MKKNVLILFALCLISLLFTGCSQNNVVHEDYISSDVLDSSSSEIISSESEEAENSSEENNQPGASSESNPPENHQQVIEPSESSTKESMPENNTLPPSNTQNISPPQYNEPVEEAPPMEETPPTTATNEGIQVFQLVNQRRKENGLAELTYRNDIQDAANIRANEIISYLLSYKPGWLQLFYGRKCELLCNWRKYRQRAKKCCGSHERLDELTWTSRQHIEHPIHRNCRRCGTISGRKLLGTNFYWITAPLSDSKQLV